MTLDPSRPVDLLPIYIEWRDHTVVEGATELTAFNHAHFCGFTNLIDETEDTYVTAQFVDKGEFGLFNVTTICKEAVLRLVRFPLPPCA